MPVALQQRALAGAARPVGGQGGCNGGRTSLIMATENRPRMKHVRPLFLPAEAGVAQPSHGAVLLPADS